jgi:S1-C subfamily serine protease
VLIPPAESTSDATPAVRPRKFLRRRALRTFAVAAVCGAVATIATSLAFARTTTTPIGTGVVVVNTNLGYQGGSAAGTGIVLTSSGEILTNNHVIRGATSVRIVAPGTGHSYPATVVGYDVKDDIAVLKAKGAPSLKTAAIGNSETLRIGSAVVARGNAGGTGAISSTSGRVTGLNRTITVNDDSGGTEQLSGLIETNAALQPGDSGGPLYSGGKVVGVDTAASTGNGYVEETASDAYAIPINRALTIAHQIESGTSSATVHIGATAFLGVAVQPSQGFDGFDTPAGGVVVQVLQNSPAANAELVPGDVITSVGGRTVTSSTTIANVLLTRKPGSKIALHYLDPYGASHHAVVTLGRGPAQ